MSQQDWKRYATKIDRGDWRINGPTARVTLMMRNLLAGGFNGPVLPVTPARKAVFRRHGTAGYR